MNPTPRQPMPIHSARADISGYLGSWVNSNLDTRWIRKIELTAKDGTFLLRTFGVNEPTDWGETEISTYLDSIGEIAFLVSYNLGSVEPMLAAYSNKGLIVVAAYLQFAEDSEKTNFLCREFFVR